jgi:hypothetical protein
MTDLTSASWVRLHAYPIADLAPDGTYGLTLELAGDFAAAARHVETQLSRIASVADDALAALRAGKSLDAGPLRPENVHRLGEAVATYEAARTAWDRMTDAVDKGTD